MTDQFKMIRPTPITDARLTSSTVVEDDCPVWAFGAFAVGDLRMMTTGVHVVFECLVAHTSTGASGAPNLNTKAQTPVAPKWLALRPTNKWAMFDRKVGTATTASNSLTVVLTPGRINSLALLQIDAATVDVDLTVEGVSVYSASMNLTSGNLVGDWYQYFYEPVYQQDSLVITDLVDATLLDLPAFSEGVLTVTLTRTGGTVSCGVLVVGLYAEIGKTLRKPKIGITDYSRKDVDTWGNEDIDQRGYSKRMSAVTVVDAAAIDNVVRVLSQYRSTLVVFVGAGNLFTCMIIYGWYRDWDMDIDHIGELSLQVEGLVGGTT